MNEEITIISSSFRWNQHGDKCDIIMVAEIFVFSLKWFQFSNDNKCPTFVSTSERQSLRNWSKMPWAFNSLTSFSSKFGSSRSKSPGPTTRSCSILSCRESPKERTFSPSHGQLHNSQNYIWINLDHCKLQGARFVSLVHCVVSVLCSVPCCCGAQQLPQWRLSRTTRETLDGAAAAPRRVAEPSTGPRAQHCTSRPDRIRLLVLFYGSNVPSRPSRDPQAGQRDGDYMSSMPELGWRHDIWKVDLVLIILIIRYKSNRQEGWSSLWSQAWKKFYAANDKQTRYTEKPIPLDKIQVAFCGPCTRFG